MEWIHELTEVLLVQAKWKMAILPEVTAVQLHHSAMGISTDSSVLSSG